jgi:hypothetical protein
MIYTLVFPYIFSLGKDSLLSSMYADHDHYDHYDKYYNNKGLIMLLVLVTVWK